MHLVIDSGSTKTLWCLVDESKVIKTIATEGINPYVTPLAEIQLNIKKAADELQHFPDAVFYYGSGCSSEKNIKILNDAIAGFYPHSYIEVSHDLLAVARALCGTEPGIAVILGTGSNSCLYDGMDIVQNTPSLGYVLGDEGSGSYLGKKIISEVWYGSMPDHLIKSFKEFCPLPLSEMLDHIYKQPGANAYLASFTKWVSNHRNDSYIKSMIHQSFSDFIQKQILPYGKSHSAAIHSTGSVAYYFNEEWKDVILQFGYKAGKTEQDPMQGLIAYHSQWKK